MKLIRQPKESYRCGQCCVAMISNIPINEACFKMGKTGYTFASDIYKRLGKPRKRKLRFTVRNRDNSILFVQWKNVEYGHWVVFNNGRIYDPAMSKSRTFTDYKDWLDRKGARIAFKLKV